MTTPTDKRIAFTFYSHPMRNVKHGWKASLVFSPGSTDDAFAELRVVDGEGVPVDGGVFELAGQRLAVSAGRGAIRCCDFVRGKHEGAIWLYRPGVEPVPGVLTFE